MMMTPPVIQIGGAIRPGRRKSARTGQGMSIGVMRKMTGGTRTVSAAHHHLLRLEIVLGLILTGPPDRRIEAMIRPVRLYAVVKPCP